jgi:hypothetical protein
MKRLETYIALVGVILAVLGYFDNKSKMATQVADISRVVLVLQAAESARVFNAKVDSAVKVQNALDGGRAPRYRRPTRNEIASKVAQNDSAVSTDSTKQFSLDVKRIQLYAKPRGR